MDYVIVIVLVMMSALFSGLTLGLLSLDKAELKRKIELGNKEAKKVYSVREKGNLLLCTLLLGNVAVNSTLAIFLGNVASGVVAGFVSTGLIVIFGEIIPQATFSRFALKVGAKTAWLVKIFMVALWPICFPISWVLDKVLGEEMMTIYSKHELMKIVEEHEGAKESEIDADENRIIKGALSFSDKSVKDVMTPRTVVFALELEQILDKKMLNKIKRMGFSRIPVYAGTFDNPAGVLYAKDLINCEAGIKVKDIYESKLMIEVLETEKLDELLNLFLKSRVHFAFVRDEFGGVDGVVTLEDVIEEVFGVDIVDEDDRTVDMRQLAKKKKNKKLRA